jgi:hypothetical protein
MPDLYFILFLKRLDADEKLQYFQLPYNPCRMVLLWNWVISFCKSLISHFIFISDVNGSFTFYMQNMYNCFVRLSTF